MVSHGGHGGHGGWIDPLIRRLMSFSKKRKRTGQVSKVLIWNIRPTRGRARTRGRSCTRGRTGGVGSPRRPVRGEVVSSARADGPLGDRPLPLRSRRSPGNHRQGSDRGAAVYYDLVCLRKDGRKDGRVEGWKGGRMEGWKNGRMEGWKVEGWKVEGGRMEEWKNGRMEGFFLRCESPL